ncbi:hypothetical protein FBQ96_03405 [Nitrospirales bacterium NOB]|nr:MAG: hypothetical protein UZ03_NOB001000753 [Nitrospira sp. OLB3]MBV6469588.1 hypothetical protein [Nitrospirota bacterium]MCE7965382.1 hypothetical protein [Nitrospira sp. NTP2]MCK6493398.1 hypothetical protein [Nitrospira sp.]MDL1888625.1 hypothetical protein [Nitrospirales bacterium NOB]MEB2338956.1 hypothetical protein [Nitrospirales bacterium]
MAKKPTAETDETRLKKKLTGLGTGEGKSADSTAVRSLRKRLKRVQRKRRSMALRAKQAAGKAEGKTEAAG